MLVQIPAAPRVAAHLRDDTVASAALGRTMKYRVLLPAGYDATRERYHALYLLHGLTGDYLDWSTRTELAHLSRALRLVIVMPDGDDSWYTNADESGPRFEDYIATDLVKDVETKYRVIRARYGRAIAGLSMGGYGALKIALKHPAQFAAAGGFSSVVETADASFDDRHASWKDQLYKVFGPAGSETRASNDLLALAAHATAASAPALWVDCGTSDALIDGNRKLAAVLQGRGLPYEYHETAGAHAWDYWNRRIEAFLPWLMKVFARTN
jgi:S-formylglutathione hydrolase FrmB